MIVKVFFILIISLALGGCTWFFPKKHKLELKKKDLEFPEVSYTVFFVFKQSVEFEKKIKEISHLIKTESSPPTSINALYYRCKEDRKRLLSFLHSLGFFDAKIKYKVKRKQQPIRVRAIITVGDRYRLKKMNFNIKGDPKDIVVTPKKLNRVVRFRQKSFVDMEKITESVKRLQRYFQNHGFPYIKIGNPEGVLDRTNKELDVDIDIELNQYQDFGEAFIEGSDFVKEQFIRNRIEWKKGDRYDVRKVDETRQKLLETGIFSSVVIDPKQAENASTMFLKVIKGPPRTIGAGVRFATSEGFGGKAYWNHRNFFGGGEVVEMLLSLSKRDSHLKLIYEKPDIFCKNIMLINKIETHYERTRAYHGTTSAVHIGLSHILNENMRYSIGVEPGYSKLKRDFTNYYYRIFSFPFSFTYDVTNDTIDPRKGWKITGDLAPHFSKIPKTDGFVRFKGTASHYLRLLSDDMVVATWGRLGFIASKKNINVPLDKRFYAGGAGSVRGYGYQLLGPLTANRIPVGGQSIVEFGVEPRLKVTEKIGFVVFAEAATVSVDSALKFNRENLLWGSGAGIRYYTDIGPIRLDVAVPLKRRKVSGRTVDSSYQIYISIGQAF